MHALRYERSAILAGEAWRLLTAHLVHDGGCISPGTSPGWHSSPGSLREYSTRHGCSILLASTVAIDVGFLVFMPELEWYVGFSGVLHGVMAAGLFAWLVRHARYRHVARRAPVRGEARLGAHRGPVAVHGRSLDLPVIHQAHSYGAIGGLARGGLAGIPRQTATSPL